MKQHYGRPDVRAVAAKSLAASKDLYDRASTLATEGAKGFAEIADTAWGNTKALNEKVMQNVTETMEYTFAAAREITVAQSLPEVARLQGEYLKSLAARATEQTNEFVGFSARATQDIVEKAQLVAAKSLKTAR